jgi:hypothetical protein
MSPPAYTRRAFTAWFATAFGPTVPARPPRRSPARCDVAVRNSRTLSVLGSWSCQFMRKIFFFKLPFFAGGGGFFWKVSHGGGPARRGGCDKSSRIGLKFDLASLVSGVYFGTLVQIFAGGRNVGGRAFVLRVRSTSWLNFQGTEIVFARKNTVSEPWGMAHRL